VDFPDNPFCASFDRVDGAIAAKQAFETTQVKRVFHGREGKADFKKAVRETEAQRAPQLLIAGVDQMVHPSCHP